MLVNIDGTGAIGVFLYTFDSTLDGIDIRARMYAPEHGITEDAATGSANAALAGLLAESTARLTQPLTGRSHKV